MTTLSADGWYIGPCPISNPSSVTILFSVASAKDNAFWAEAAVYKATPVWNGNVTTFSMRGYTDILSTVLSTGLKSVTVNVTGISLGDHIWVGIGSRSTTSVLQVRGALADTLQTGMHQTGLGRPSTAGDPVSGTLAGATVVPAWIVVRFNA